MAAFASGGRAALEAIERAGYDVLRGPPRASSRRRAAALARILVERRGWSGRSPPRTREAYRQCESLTRAAAGNFYWGIRLLPPRKRRAMCAVYAFARRVDDIADGGLEREEKLRRLDAVAAALEQLSPEDTDPVMAALADASARFQLPQESLRDLIAGVRMDVTGTSYADFAELEVYCRRVAGSVGGCVWRSSGPKPENAPSTDALASAHLRPASDRPRGCAAR